MSTTPGTAYKSRLSGKVAVGQTDGAGHGENSEQVVDEGYLVLAVRRDRQGPLTKTNGNYAPLQVDPAGNLRVLQSRATISTLTSVASANTAKQLLGPNNNRLAAMIFNDSTAVLYVALGGGVSTTNYTVQVAASGYYEVPFWWSGEITGVWASANGSARVTELIGVLASELS